MKIRIIVYTLLIILISFLATAYLIHANQERILEAARYKLSSMARDKWGLELEVGESQLNLYRNSVYFKSVDLRSEAYGVNLRIAEMDMTYSLTRLLQGEVYFNKIRFSRPSLEMRDINKLKEETRGGEGSVAYEPKVFLTALAISRKIEIEEGSLTLYDNEGRRQLFVKNLGMQLSFEEEKLKTRLWSDTIEVDYERYHFVYERCFLRGELTEKGFDLKKLTLVGQAGILKAAGVIERDGRISGDVDFQSDLSTLSGSIDGLIPMGGEMAGVANVQWSRDQYLVTGQLKTRSAVLGKEPLPDSVSRFSLTRESCSFERIESRPHRGAEMSGHGKLTWTPGNLRYEFRLQSKNIKPASVKFLREHLPVGWLNEAGLTSGQINFQGRTAKGGDKPLWSVEMDIMTSAERFLGSESIGLQGSLQGFDKGRLSFRDFAIESSSIRAKWSGNYTNEEGYALALITESEKISEILSTLGIEWLDGRGEFAADIKGKKEDLKISGGGTIEKASLNGVHLDKIYGKVVYHDRQYTTEGLRIENNGGSALLSGSLQTDGKMILDGVLEIRGIDYSIGQGLLELTLPASGPLYGRVSFSGSMSSLTGSGSLSSSAMKYKDHRLDAASLDFSFDPSVFEFHKLAVRRGNGSFEFQGAIGNKNSLTGDLVLNVKDLGPWTGDMGLEGMVEVSGRVEGVPKDPDFKGELRWSGVRIRGKEHEDIFLQLGKKEGLLKAEGRLLDNLEGIVKLSLDSPYLFSGEFAFDKLGIGYLTTYIRELKPSWADQLSIFDGYLGGTMTLLFPLGQRGEISGEIDLEELELILEGEVSRLYKPTRITFTSESLEVEEMIVGGNLHQFTLSGWLRPDGSDFMLKGIVDLAFLGERIDFVEKVRGKPHIALEITGPVFSPSIRGSVEIAGGMLQVPWLKEELRQIDGRFEFDNNRIRGLNIEATLGEGRIKGEGEYEFHSEILNISASGVVPLEAIEWPFKGLKEHKGRGELEIKISGNINDPEIRLEATIEDGMVRFKDYPSPLEDIFIKFSVNDGYIRVQEASAGFSRGKVNASGYLIWPFKGALKEINMDLTAEKIYLTHPGTLKAFTFADLNLSGGQGNFMLRGKMSLERGKYFRNMTPRPIILFGKEAEGTLEKQAKTTPFLSGVNIDILLFCDDGFWIDNNVAQINTSLNLKFTSNLLKPHITGEIHALEGKVYYLGKVFNLSESLIVFSDRYPPEPHISLQASTSVSDVDIFLTIGGNISRMTLDLYSDPPYSEEDIVSLLTFGAPRSQLDDKGREVSTLGAAMVFSGPILTRIEDQARDVTGLEVFQVETTMSDTGSAARLVIGKRLSDRIFISYSRNLTLAKDERFSLEYQILDFVSLIGEQDRRGVYSFDLVFLLGLP